jgi:DNA-binding NarL/FixJ family response regulator
MSVNVLLFDRDAISLAAMRDVLIRAKYHAECTQTVEGAIDAATQIAPEVAVIDLISDAASGLEVLRALRQRPRPPSCVVILRFGHEHRRAEAIGLGAFDCVDQPLTASLLTTLVNTAAAYERVDASAPPLVLHSIARWAEVVVRTIECQHDPRTLAEWGRAIGVSTGALRNWCRTARISARQSLLFARMLRAVVKQARNAVALEDLLNVVDRRTIAKMLAAAGSSPSGLPQDVNEFLARQRFISGATAISSISVALQAREMELELLGIRRCDHPNARRVDHHLTWADQATPDRLRPREGDSP